MHHALTDKTNKKKTIPMKLKTNIITEKQNVIAFLENTSNKTKDLNLKYDLNKCIEILEGKENQETKDLKEMLEDILLEKEILFKEKCELVAEINHIRSEGRKKKLNLFLKLKKIMKID